MQDSKLLELRNKIDSIDEELLKLLATRSELVLQVGKHKEESGEQGNYIRSGREAAMIRNLTAKGAGAFPPAAIKGLWRIIISASLSLESGLKVALPEKSGFDLHKLVVEYFGNFTQYKQYEFDEDVLAAVDKQTVAVLMLESGWWLELAEKKNVKIFARLADGIFAAGKLETEESGNDITLAITHADKHAGHKIASHGKVKLVEIQGFHREIDDMVVIGHYGV